MRAMVEMPVGRWNQYAISHGPQAADSEAKDQTFKVEAGPLGEVEQSLLAAALAG